MTQLSKQESRRLKLVRKHRLDDLKHEHLRLVRDERQKQNQMRMRARELRAQVADDACTYISLLLLFTWDSELNVWTLSGALRRIIVCCAVLGLNSRCLVEFVERVLWSASTIKAV